MKIPYLLKPLQNFSYTLLLFMALLALASVFSNSVATGTTVNRVAKRGASTSSLSAGHNSASSMVTRPVAQTQTNENGLIAFSRWSGVGRPGTRDIYVMNPNGSGQKNITYDAQDDYLPVWSPDGTKIAFHTEGNEGYGIAVMNADGSGKRLITDNSNDSLPTWSPDGTRIAFSGYRDSGGFGIYVVNSSDGSELTKLADGNNPSWSPDGNKIAFKSGLPGISLMNADGSDITYITIPPPLYDASQYDWSPDSTKLVFMGIDYESQRSVYTINIDGTGLTQIPNTTGSPYVGLYPTWSPDGAKITFTLNFDIYVINPDGTELTQLTSGPVEDSASDWQLKQPGATPLPETFTLSGRIVSNIMAAHPVTLSGTLGRSIYADNDGYYTFDGLQAGGDYTITPINPTYSYEPANQVINNLSANQTVPDFTATYIPISITGRITDTTGAPMPNIEVTSYGGFPQGTTLTDANGYYSFPDVQRRRDYAIYTEFAGAYTFAPETYNFQDLNESVVANFVGTKQPSHTISGRVTSSDAPNVGLAGVRLELARSGVVVGAVFTDASGYYTFGERQDGYDYGVYPQMEFNYAYVPSSYEFLNLQSNQTANFVRYPVAGYQQISGQILDQHKNPVSEAWVTLSGAFNQVTITGPDGRYTFYNMPAGAGFNYTVTPSKSGYDFFPGQRSFTLRGDQTINFRAMQARQ